MTPPASPVVVLGAGLTGLSAAWHLRRAGGVCRVFERADRPGGHAVTLDDDGFRFDRTGHLLHLRDAEMRRLALSWIGDDWVEVERRSMIWSSGVYTRYPFQANTLGLPPAVAYECVVGFVRAQLAKERGEAPTPQNFEQYCLVHFGEGISRHFMIPYNTRLWGVPPSAISAAWCERFVPRPSLEDVLAGAVGHAPRELGYNTRFVYPRLGIGVLSDGLAKAAGDLELGRSVVAVDWKQRRVVVEPTAGGASESVPYEVAVSTLPLPVLCERLVDAPAPVREAGRRLTCTHLWYLDVALDVPCGQPLHWVYVPEAKYPFYRVGCYSNFSAAMAPAGKANLYVELADRAAPDLAALLPAVAAGLTELGIVPGPEAIRFARLRRIDYAYVVFDHAYFEALDVIRPFLSEHRIVSTGRYGGWNYSSMEDALLFGREAAGEARRLLDVGPAGAARGGA